MMRYFLASILLIVVILLPTNIQAEEEKPNLTNKLGYESVNPGSHDYILKRLLEEIKLKLSFSKEQKAKYYAYLLDLRFKELAYIVHNNKYGILENVTNRYNTTLGTIIDNYPESYPLIKKQTTPYLPVLEELRDKYHSNSAQWLMIQYTIDLTKQLINSSN